MRIILVVSALLIVAVGCRGKEKEQAHPWPQRMEYGVDRIDSVRYGPSDTLTLEGGGLQWFRINTRVTRISIYPNWTARKMQRETTITFEPRYERQTSTQR